MGNDAIGIELAGALKNVYAIASGIAEGLGFENNTRASKEKSDRICEEKFMTDLTVLITRSLAEMTRIGAAYGASPLTFL